jgi:hypothetical protein
VVCPPPRLTSKYTHLHSIRYGGQIDVIEK